MFPLSDTVVDLECGTGRNFPWTERGVTASGRIVGVNLTDAMLREAQRRVERAPREVAASGCAALPVRLFADGARVLLGRLA